MSKLLNSLKSKFILIITLVAVLCFSSFFLIACGDEEEAVTETPASDPTYTYSQEDDSDISNSKFDLDAVNKELSDFPIVSTTGWTKASDNSSYSSAVDSGVINLSNDGWDKLLSKLYDDKDFLNYLKQRNWIDLTDVENTLKSEHSTEPEYKPTEAEIKEKAISVIKEGNKFYNPDKYDSSADNYVYMLNNISSKLGIGTAQKLTSSTSITVEKGKVAQISLWVNTQNIRSNNPNFGANIRLTNTFNATTQAEYKINNINTNGAWEKYTIYVKGDERYNCTFILVLGLGYGNGNSTNASDYVEGTVFFDDIEYSTIEEIPNEVAVDKLNYAGKEPVYDPSRGGLTYAFDMSFNETAFESGNAKFEDKGYTTSNTGISAPETAITKTILDDSVVIDIPYSKNTSYTVKVTGDDFTLSNTNEKRFTFVSFDIKNELSKFGSTDITVDLFDEYNGNQIKRAACTSFTKTSDDVVNCGILVNNDFINQERSFYLEIVIGPTNVVGVNDYDFASGKVTLNNLKVVKGVVPDSESESYESDIYSFYKKVAKTSVYLYAGYPSNYTEDEENTTNSYSLSIAPGSIGAIASTPVDVKTYVGITPDHAYIKADSNVFNINTRTGSGNADGVAGLINTKYLANYTDELGISEDNIKTLLNFETGNDDIQPLMIYNKTANHYGFISNDATVSANDYVSLSITLRVTGDAKAYLYLIDASQNDKNVLTFKDFTVNNTFSKGVADGTKVNGQDLKYQLVIDKTMMDEDGWVTATFYIAAGANDKKFRLEMWNGERSENGFASQGFVFIKKIDVVTSYAFSEPSRVEDAFSVSGNPLFEQKMSSFEQLYAYQRELTDTEKQFNIDYPDMAISYSTNYVWAKNYKTVYGVYNTVDPVVNDPYASVVEEEEEKTGCAAEKDPSTFWLSFSSILLGVVLVLAIIALFIKGYRRKHKASANDAKSHYKVTSRIDAQKKIKAKKQTSEEAVEEQEDDEKETDTAEDSEASETVEEVNDAENVEEKEPEKEETLDSYVYGDVQDFGENKETPSVEETVEENAEEVSVEEKTEEDK